MRSRGTAGVSRGGAWEWWSHGIANRRLFDDGFSGLGDRIPLPGPRQRRGPRPTACRAAIACCSCGRPGTPARVALNRSSDPGSSLRPGAPARPWRHSARVLGRGSDVRLWWAASGRSRLPRLPRAGRGPARLVDAGRLLWRTAFSGAARSLACSRGSGGGPAGLPACAGSPAAAHLPDLVWSVVRFTAGWAGVGPGGRRAGGDPGAAGGRCGGWEPTCWGACCSAGGKGTRPGGVRPVARGLLITGCGPACGLSASLGCPRAALSTGARRGAAVDAARPLPAMWGSVAAESGACGDRGWTLPCLRIRGAPFASSASMCPRQPPLPAADADSQSAGPAGVVGPASGAASDAVQRGSGVSPASRRASR